MHFEELLQSHLFPADLEKGQSKFRSPKIKYTPFFFMKSRINQTTLNPETTYWGSSCQEQCTYTECAMPVTDHVCSYSLLSV